MNWDAIGAVGELVGAAAVVATLLYLSVQMRLSRKAAQVQSSYSTIDVYSRWRAHLIENERLAQIVAKADRGEALLPEEDITVSTLMDDLCIALAVTQVSGAAAQAFYTDAMRTSTPEIEYLLRLFREHPGLAPYWGRIREYLSLIRPDFVADMNARLEVPPVQSSQSHPGHPV